MLDVELKCSKNLSFLDVGQEEVWYSCIVFGGVKRTFIFCIQFQCLCWVNFYTLSMWERIFSILKHEHIVLTITYRWGVASLHALCRRLNALVAFGLFYL